MTPPFDWTFELNSAEHAALHKFLRKKGRGNLVVKFIDTEIGQVIKVKREGDKKWVNITDYKSW